MRRRRMGPNAGVVGGVIITGLGLWMAVTRAGTDLATFGWLLVLVGTLSIVANLVVGARMR
jgi:hypothetical protein